MFLQVRDVQLGTSFLWRNWHRIHTWRLPKPLRSWMRCSGSRSMLPNHSASALGRIRSSNSRGAMLRCQMDVLGAALERTLKAAGKWKLSSTLPLENLLGVRWRRAGARSPQDERTAGGDRTARMRWSAPHPRHLRSGLWFGPSCTW